MILVPLTLIDRAFIPWAITPLLDGGGRVSCFEGVEEGAARSLQARKHKEDPRGSPAAARPLANQGPHGFERDKVRRRYAPILFCQLKLSRLRWGLWLEAPLLNQILILSGIALLVTVGGLRSGGDHRQA